MLVVPSSLRHFFRCMLRRILAHGLHDSGDPPFRFRRYRTAGRAEARAAWRRRSAASCGRPWPTSWSRAQSPGARGARKRSESAERPLRSAVARVTPCRSWGSTTDAFVAWPKDWLPPQGSFHDTFRLHRLLPARDVFPSRPLAQASFFSDECSGPKRPQTLS